MNLFDPPYHGMSKERWEELFAYSVGRAEGVTMTEQESLEGWHFCWGWDGMLLNRHHDHDEMKSCPCFDNNPNLDV